MTTPFVPVSNCTRTSLLYGWQGQNVVNTFHFVWSAPPTQTDREAINTAMHTFWTNHLKTHLSNAIALSQIVTVDLSSQNAPASTLVISGGESGSIAQPSVPNNTAISVTTRTDFRGRNYRGRVYVPGIDKTAMTDSVSASLTRIAELLGDFEWLLTAANTAGAIWSVVSRFLNKAPRATGLKTPITAVSADNYWDSQRRRLLGRGT